MATPKGVGLATTLPLTAAVPPLLAGAAALALPGWASAVLGVLLAAAAGLAAWMLLRPLAQAAVAADAVVAGGSALTLPAAGGAEAGRLVAAARAVEERLAAELAATQHDLQAALKRGDDAKAQGARLQKVLDAVPVPVGVAAPDGRLLLMNATAEAQFGLGRPGWWQKGVDVLVPDAAEARAVKAWLAAGVESRRESVARDVAGKRQAVEWLTQAGTDARRDGMHVFVAYSLTRHRQAAANGRAALAKRLIRRVAREHAEPVRTLDGQLRLLLQESKQDSHRDRLVPKVSAAIESLRQVRSVQWVLEWWDRLEGETPVPSPSEFIAGEVVHTARDLLGPRLRARRNSLTVKDEGGWVLCDLDMLQTALTAILLHACDAVSNGAIEVRVRRATTADGERVRFEVVDAGKSPSPTALAALAWPFATESAPPDEFPGVGGFPLALALARRLAPPLGGSLNLAADPTGQLVAVLDVPCRPGTQPVVVESIGGDELPAPEEETCAGWRLGFAE